MGRPLSKREAADPSAWERLSELDEYRELCRARLSHLVEVRQPWVLVSQIQRSGGTLLAELFDGHPECHAHPHEVKIGRPRKSDWPPLDLERPESWFGVLFEKRSAIHFVRGYEKSAKRRNEYDAFPFLFLPRLQKAIFDSCVDAWSPASERDVLDCYFTSFFNAWLDNENLHARPKRIVTGFTPRLALDPANRSRYFAAYPDGMLISIVRDPRSWWASASRYQPERYADLTASLELWRTSTEAALAAREHDAERVLLLTYEQLVRHPQKTMAMVAERLGIAMLPVLLEPTFNGRPIRANSSESVGGFGIRPERADAHRYVLDATTIDRIDELTGDLYERASAAAG